MGQAISTELAAFCHSGVSILVGTRDRCLFAECVRAVGARVERGRRELSVFVPLATGAVTAANLADNQRIAVCFTRIEDHRSIQFKGRAVAVALASDASAALFRETASAKDLSRVRFSTQRAREVMAASDVVLVASGTATLEALLIRRPMVVAYKMVPLTYWLVRRLGVAKLAHFSLPNLLAGRELVPEFIQEQVRPDVMGPAVLGALDGTQLAAGWYDQFTEIHRQLRCDASASAAREVLALVRGSR